MSVIFIYLFTSTQATKAARDYPAVVKNIKDDRKDDAPVEPSEEMLAIREKVECVHLLIPSQLLQLVSASHEVKVEAATKLRRLLSIGACLLLYWFCGSLSTERNPPISQAIAVGHRWHDSALMFAVRRRAVACGAAGQRRLEAAF